jgi:RNA polymerase sigma-70 factor (ECF subfamily)
VSLAALTTATARNGVARVPEPIDVAGAEAPVQAERPATPWLTLDADSREWLRCLSADGVTRDEAIVRLHALLLRAARFEVARRRATMRYLRGGELDDIATESADDALMSVLRRLEDFRGMSRFTTWVYKFALLEAAVKLRKRAWQEREVPLEPDTWDLFVSAGLEPAAEIEQSELLSTLRQAIGEILTPRQRRVLVALALDGVPIDVLADRLGTTRGALYKTLHDARRKLRAHLVERGLSVDEAELRDAETDLARTPAAPPR